MENLNAEQIKKALECCRYGGRCDECPCFEIPNCQALANNNALALIKSQEQRIKELTDENDAWQKRLIATEEKADKAYYELACEVENLRAENQNLHASCTELTRKCASLNEVNERLIVTLKMNDAPIPEGLQIVHDFCEKRKKEAKADTVRKMQERITEHATNGYPRKVRLDVIDQIAKEIIKETNK